MKQLDSNTLNRIHDEFRKLIEEDDLMIAYEVYAIDRVLLSYMDPRLSKDKANWLRRKRNVVLTFGQSSLSIAEKNNYNQDVFNSKYGYSYEDMTLTGGAVPVLDEKGTMIGVITVTGLTPQEDHDLALSVI